MNSKPGNTAVPEDVYDVRHVRLVPRDEPKHVTCERVVKEHTVCRVFAFADSPKRIVLDAMTANAILTVYKALSPENQAKFDGLSWPKLAAFAWKHVQAA